MLVCKVTLTLTSQLLTDESREICVVLFSWKVFTFPGCPFGLSFYVANISIIADYLQASRESTDRIRQEKQHLLGKNTPVPNSAWKHWAGEIPWPCVTFTRVAISVNPSMDSINLHQPISFRSLALCMIKSIYKSFASCRCYHKSPVGPASATGCLTNAPQ